MEGSIFLFLVYLYNLHDPDFNGSWVLSSLFEHNASPICAHCHAIANTAMHTLLFCPSWALKRTSLFERLGLDVLDRTYGSIVRAPYVLVCASLCIGQPSRIFASRHAQEGAGRMAASGPEVVLLARACLRSDDNHV